MSILQEFAAVIWFLPAATQVILPLAILAVYLIWQTSKIPFRAMGLI